MFTTQGLYTYGVFHGASNDGEPGWHMNEFNYKLRKGGTLARESTGLRGQVCSTRPMRLPPVVYVMAKLDLGREAISGQARPRPRSLGPRLLSSVAAVIQDVNTAASFCLLSNHSCNTQTYMRIKQVAYPVVLARIAPLSTPKPALIKLAGVDQVLAPPSFPHSCPVSGWHAPPACCQ